METQAHSKVRFDFEQCVRMCVHVQTNTEQSFTLSYLLAPRLVWQVSAQGWPAQHLALWEQFCIKGEEYSYTICHREDASHINSVLLLFSFCFFETGSHVARAGLELFYVPEDSSVLTPESLGETCRREPEVHS